VALGRDLQREPRQGRRAISEEGLEVYIEGQLQTRKWQDQSGVEKYTTEIVLQRFRGELTILDSRGQGGSDEYGEGGGAMEDRSSGSSFGRSGPSSGGASRQPAMAGGGGGGRSSSSHLDDDIPF
jgi:single-strand DNA-binding protein